MPYRMVACVPKTMADLAPSAADAIGGGLDHVYQWHFQV